jgi:hypothetical protein
MPIKRETSAFLSFALTSGSMSVLVFNSLGKDRVKKWRFPNRFLVLAEEVLQNKMIESHTSKQRLSENKARNLPELRS